MLATTALMVLLVGLGVDFLVRAEHLDRYGPKKARRRATDSV